MRIFKTNILSNNILKSANAICFTSNGIVKRDGRLVMGAGVAKQFRDAFVDLDQEAGTAVKANGNICQIIKSIFYLGNSLNIIAFPTKWHWKEKSDIKLIESSLSQLIDMANRFGWKSVYLPCPGVNNGKLNFKIDIEPILRKKLDDRFIITFLPKGWV